MNIFGLTILLVAIGLIVWMGWEIFHPSDIDEDEVLREEKK